MKDDCDFHLGIPITDDHPLAVLRYQKEYLTLYFRLLLNRGILQKKELQWQLKLTEQ